MDIEQTVVTARTAQHTAQSTRKRPLSDTSGDETDCEDVKRVKSVSALSNEGVTPLESSKQEQESSKTSRDRKRRHKKKKKRKISLVDESARMEKSASERRSQTLVATRSPTIRPSSSKLAPLDVVMVRDNAPTAGPSRADQEFKPIISKSQVEADTTEGAASFTQGAVVESVLKTNGKMDKGKGRAPSTSSRLPSPAAPPIPGPSSFPVASSLSTATDMRGPLTAHQNLIATLLPSLTCRVCLYLMNRPFALAPCGHVVCHSCLISWFSTPPQNVVDARLPPPSAAGGVQNGANAAVDPLPAVPVLRRPHSIYRRKTCPHCRAVVRERPVEVWGMKEMVTSFTKSGLVPDTDIIGPATPDAPASEDPWRGIFPDTASFGAAGLPANLPSYAVRDLMGIQDNEDGGIFRCVDCMHEIEDGRCSGCRRIYGGHAVGGLWPFDDSGSDDDYDDDLYNEAVDEMHFVQRAYSALVTRPRVPVSDEDVEEDDSDDEYGGSFIDDGDDSDVRIVEDPRPRLQRARSRNHALSEDVILISSDEEDQVNIPMPPRVRRGRNTTVIWDEPEDDEGLADRVAANERELYGDDGSLPARSLRLQGGIDVDEDSSVLSLDLDSDEGGFGVSRWADEEDGSGGEDYDDEEELYGYH